jgi:hypothetical protein
MSQFNWDDVPGGEFAPAWKHTEGASIAGEVVRIELLESKFEDSPPYPCVTIALADGASAATKDGEVRDGEVAWHASAARARRKLKVKKVREGELVRVERLPDDGMAHDFAVERLDDDGEEIRF